MKIELLFNIPSSWRDELHKSLLSPVFVGSADWEAAKRQVGNGRYLGGETSQAAVKTISNVFVTFHLSLVSFDLRPSTL